MKLTLLIFLLLGSLTAFGKEKKSSKAEIPSKNESRTTAEIMKENKISQKDLCDTACQSKFSKCYDGKKEKGFKCAAEAVTCKNKCK